MDNNLRNFRLKLIFLALCILILLAIKGHIKLGYAPELERKSIAVAFDYYGAFEKEIEILVSHLEEAYMEVRGIRDIYSVSEPGRGYILCQFSEQIRLDEAYVQISDITAYVYADFPEGVNRPVITRSASDSYPVYISWFPIKRESDAAYIREAYEAVPGAGEVELGGRKKKELMVELHTGRLTGMALASDVLGSRLRSSNLARKVAMPGGQTLVLSSRLSSAADFGQVQVEPSLKLSDIATLEYKEAESHSLGHIDGQSMLLFFVMKSGEGNTVRLCRQLDAVTSRFGGSQFFSLGNEIEKSFIVTSSILLLLFIFLLFDLWFKTRNIQLVSQATCRSILSLLVAIAAVTTAGFQVDMTVMAALFLVVVFSTRENNSKLFQTAMEEAEEQENTFDKPESYTKAAELLKGKRNAKDNTLHNDEQGIDAEVSNRNIKKMAQGQPLKDNVPTKVHAIAIGNLDKLFKNAAKAWDKPDTNNDPSIKKIDRFIAPLYVDGKGYIALMTVKEFNNPKDKVGLYTVEELDIKENPAGLTTVADTDNIDLLAVPLTGFASSIIQKVNSVNQNSHTNLLPIAIILFTLILTLYAPVYLKNLILPFCITLASGFCTYVICQFFMKGISTLKYRVSPWCFSPILLFILFLICHSSLSPWATDVSFSMEYESGTSFSFIQQSALDVEADLLKWNEFDHLTLYIDQGRASFTIIGGSKRDILKRIHDLSAVYPEIFFYIPEKHTRHAIEVTVYGNDVLEIENNILRLAKYVKESADNVNIIYNFKSDVTNIVLEIPVKCASAGIYPYDVYKTLYCTVSEPVVDKYFAGDVETDVKIRGESKYRETLPGLLSVPIPSPSGMAGTAGDYISVRKESAQGRIYHKNRMRSMSLSLTGISRSKLGKIVSNFPFTGSCHGEVCQ